MLEFTLHLIINKGNMNIKREDLKDSQVKLTIEVPAGMLHLFSEEAYKKLAPKVKISGFRPGKAPKHLVEKELGSEVINNEILEIAFQKTFYEAVMKEKLVTVSPPQVKVLKFVPTDGLTYEAVVTILPEVKLPDFKSIKLKKKEVKLEEKEVDNVLEDLKKQHSTKKEVKRAAKKDDNVEIDFTGTMKGLPFEGGTSKNHPLVIGSNTMIPGFEKGIEGMNKDEEKDIKVTFPKEYQVEHLAGKEVDFKIKLHRVEEIVLPELNDEFAAKVGSFKDIKGLRENIEKGLNETRKEQEKKELEEDLLKKALEKSKIEAPKSLVDDEVKRMVQETEHNLSHSGLELDKYLEHVKKTREEFENELKKEAKKRVATGLILSEVVKENTLTVDEKEVKEEMEKFTKHIPEEKKEDAKKYYESEDGKRGIENNILTKKAIDWMMGEVTVE